MKLLLFKEFISLNNELMLIILFDLVSLIIIFIIKKIIYLRVNYIF